MATGESRPHSPRCCLAPAAGHDKRLRPGDNQSGASLAVTDDDILVTAIELFQDQAASPLEVYPLTAWRRSGDEWVPTGPPV